MNNAYCSGKCLIALCLPVLLGITADAEELRYLKFHGIYAVRLNAQSHGLPITQWRLEQRLEPVTRALAASKSQLFHRGWQKRKPVLVQYFIITRTTDKFSPVLVRLFRQQKIISAASLWVPDYENVNGETLKREMKLRKLSIVGYGFDNAYQAEWFRFAYQRRVDKSNKNALASRIVDTIHCRRSQNC